MGTREKKQLSTLKTKAKPALAVPRLVEVASSANSPNQAYDLAYLETGDVKLSLACKNLAAIKRDYGKKAFDGFVLPVVSGRPDSHNDLGKSKGGSNMPKVDKETENQTTNEEQPVEEFKLPALPLKHIEFRVAVRGNHARVRAMQSFSNDTENPIEAVYVFPMPDEATVIGCKMKIGEKSIVSELKESKTARQEYDDAINAGHHGTLMEQERPNIFTMNVGGIEPGESISVEIDYIQRVPWQASGGRFTIPTVVAPRFIPGNPIGQQSNGWSPDTDEVLDASRITPSVSKEGVSYDAEVNVSFAPGFRCKLSSPSHPRLIAETTVAKNNSIEIKTGNITTDRDFILVYRSLHKQAALSVHTGTHEGEGFIVASIIPPNQTVVEDMDIVFVLDRSGSMGGAKMAGLKQITKMVLRKLKAQDLNHRVGIVIYDDSTEVLNHLGEINEKMISSIDDINSRGMTYTGRALTQAHHLFGDSSRPKAIMLISDGQTEDKHYDGSGIPIFTIGIDSAVNDTFLKDVARETNAAYESFFPGEDYSRAENTLVGMLSGSVFKDIIVDGLDGEIVGVTDVFNGRPATMAIKFDGSIPDSFKVSGILPDGTIHEVMVPTKSAEPCDFAAQIWAREFIRETKNSPKQLTASLKYGVLCGQTSFVAVSLKEVPGQKPERVEIPVALPYTWDYDAVFGSSLTASMVNRSHFSANVSSARVGARMDTRFGSFNDGGGLIGSLSSMGPMEMNFDDLDFDQSDSGLVIEEFGFEEMEEIDSPDELLAFALDSDNPLECLAAILTVADSGDIEQAKKALEDFSLTVSLIESMTDKQRFNAYYYILRLASYGLRVSLEVTVALSKEPSDNDRVTRALYNLCKKEQGLPYELVLLGSDDVSHQYLDWKFGRAPRPTTKPWSLVP